MIIATDNLTKTLGHKLVLRGVCLRVSAGERVRIRGGNGAGKSTLLSCLAGVLRLDSGTVSSFGEAPRSRRSSAIGDRRVGYAAQGYSFLYPLLSPRENLCLVAELTDNDPKVVESLIENFGISWFADQRTFTLSEGMRRRLLLARAMVASPKLLLLDEPTSGLDAVGVGQLTAALEQFQKQDGTLILVSHDDRFSAQHCNVEYQLTQGQLSAI